MKPSRVLLTSTTG